MPRVDSKVSHPFWAQPRRLTAAGLRLPDSGQAVDMRAGGGSRQAQKGWAVAITVVIGPRDVVVERAMSIWAATH